MRVVILMLLLYTTAFAESAKFSPPKPVLTPIKSAVDKYIEWCLTSPLSPYYQPPSLIEMAHRKEGKPATRPAK